MFSTPLLCQVHCLCQGWKTRMWFLSVEGSVWRAWWWRWTIARKRGKWAPRWEHYGKAGWWTGKLGEFEKLLELTERVSKQTKRVVRVWDVWNGNPGCGAIIGNTYVCSAYFQMSFDHDSTQGSPILSDTVHMHIIETKFSWNSSYPY